MGGSIMAVTIDGTTGVSAVQDGVVQTADLASGAVTTAKIANTVNLGRRNLIINGAMQVAQRSTSIASSDNSNEGFVALDRWSWRWNNSISGQATLSQSTDVPAGFANSWKAAVTTANGTIGSGTSEWCYLYQPIEAQNLQHLNYGTSDAKTVTLSFYAKRVGTWGPISVGLQTRDGTDEYINSSIELNTTWTRHTVTFVGSTTATINNDTGSGMDVFFSVAGSQTGSFTGAASSSWSTTRQDFDNQIGNFLASTSNEFYITGVQLEVGDAATPFEHRSYGEELALCQRYYFTTGWQKRHAAIASGYYWNETLMFPTQMRANPTCTWTTNYGSGYTMSAFEFSNSGSDYNGNGVRIDFRSASSSASAYLYGTVTADSEL
jgi:hypothetical protein